MSQAEKIAALMALHNPSHIGNAMVYEVWNDGEVTLTKGEDLYGQRNLHCIMTGNPGRALPVESLPARYKHSRIVVADYEAAIAARAIILGLEP